MIRNPTSEHPAISMFLLNLQQFIDIWTTQLIIKEINLKLYICI